MKNAWFWVLAILSIMMLVPVTLAIVFVPADQGLQGILGPGLAAITFAVLAVGVAILGRDD